MTYSLTLVIFRNFLLLSISTDVIRRAWYKRSYIMAARRIESRRLDYPMIHLLIVLKLILYTGYDTAKSLPIFCPARSNLYPLLDQNGLNLHPFYTVWVAHLYWPHKRIPAQLSFECSHSKISSTDSNDITTLHSITKQHHRKVLLSSFHLNGYTLGFHIQVQTL